MLCVVGVMELCIGWCRYKIKLENSSGTEHTFYNHFARFDIASLLGDHRRLEASKTFSIGISPERDRSAEECPTDHYVPQQISQLGTLPIVWPMTLLHSLNLFYLSLVRVSRDVILWIWLGLTGFARRACVPCSRYFYLQSWLTYWIFFRQKSCTIQLWRGLNSWFTSTLFVAAPIEPFCFMRPLYVPASSHKLMYYT